MDVIEVAAKVIREFPQTYFIIVGDVVDPDYLIRIKCVIEQKGLMNNVILHGYTAQVSDFMCGSDLMLHSARKEPQGRVILEAMAACLPVVAYRVGGIGESVIGDQTAFLLALGDIKGLANAVCKLLKDSNLRHQMGNVGYHRVKENFTAVKTAQAVREVISQII